MDAVKEVQRIMQAEIEGRLSYGDEPYDFWLARRQNEDGWTIETAGAMGSVVRTEGLHLSESEIYRALRGAWLAVHGEKYLHQLGDGRWVVAYWSEANGQWYAPMTEAERRATGCHTYFARTLEGLGCTSYASRRAAADRAWKLYGPDDPRS